MSPTAATSRPRTPRASRAGARGSKPRLIQQYLKREDPQDQDPKRARAGGFERRYRPEPREFIGCLNWVPSARARSRRYSPREPNYVN